MKKILFLILGVIAIITVGTLVGDGFNFGIEHLIAGGLILAEGIPVGGTVDDDTFHDNAAGTGVDLIDEDVDRKIMQIRPDIAQLDTLLREIGSVKTNSEVVRFGQSGIITDAAEVQANVASNTSKGGGVISVPVASTVIQTILKDQIYELKGVLNTAGETIRARVVGKDESTNVIHIYALNGDTVSTYNHSIIPAQTSGYGIDTGTEMFINSVSKSLKDAKTDPLSMLPETQTNNCQIYMAQVEEAKYTQLQAKKVDWGMVNYKSDTLYKFRLEQELSKMTGIKSETFDPYNNNRRILTSGGIESFVGFNFLYNTNDTVGTAGGLTEDLFASWGEALTEVYSSENKFFFVTPALMVKLLKIRSIQRQIEANKSEMMLGFRVNKIDTGFNTLNLVISKALKIGGRNGEGVIIDKENLRLRVFDPMHWRQLDLLTSGESKSDAWVLEERSTIEVMNPKAHAWVYASTSTVSEADSIQEANV